MAREPEALSIPDRVKPKALQEAYGPWRSAWPKIPLNKLKFNFQGWACQEHNMSLRHLGLMMLPLFWWIPRLISKSPDICYTLNFYFKI